MPPGEEIRFPLDLFQVVRGSILIKNAIDTTGGARVIDVVETEDGDGDVDPNTNLFHGRYYQNKENPMYSSDEDLSKLGRPKFTEIFRQDETDFTEIPVHKGRI